MAVTDFPNGVSTTTVTATVVSGTSFAGEFIRNKQVASANGAITIKDGIVIITKGTACALTLAAPTAGTDDGKMLVIDSTTAAAHTVTIANGLRGVGASADLGTFGGAIGDGVTLYAYNGAWYPIRNTNVGFT